MTASEFVTQKHPGLKERNQHLWEVLVGTYILGGSFEDEKPLVTRTQALRMATAIRSAGGQVKEEYR